MLGPETLLVENKATDKSCTIVSSVLINKQGWAESILIVCLRLSLLRHRVTNQIEMSRGK